jgi:hypothetical protein
VALFDYLAITALSYWFYEQAIRKDRVMAWNTAM